MPKVVASEIGKAQTFYVFICSQMNKLIDEYVWGVVILHETKSEIWNLFQVSDLRLESYHFLDKVRKQCG